MEAPSEFPVTYKGEEVLFAAQLIQFGYNHCFAINVYGTTVYFEPNEEKTYRAIVEEEHLNKKLTVDLQKSIAAAIEEALK